MNLIGLIVTVVILGLAWYLLYWLLSQMPLKEPFGTVARVLLGLLAVVVLLGLLFGGIPIPKLHLN